MNYKLHTAIRATGNAVSELTNVDFYEQHMPPYDHRKSIKQARSHLMDALDGLSAYQAEIDAAEAKAKVAA